MQKFTKDFLVNRHVLLKNFSMILKKEIRFFFSQKRVIAKSVVFSPIFGPAILELNCVK